MDLHLPRQRLCESLLIDFFPRNSNYGNHVTHNQLLIVCACNVDDKGSDVGAA